MTVVFSFFLPEKKAHLIIPSLNLETDVSDIVFPVFCDVDEVSVLLWALGGNMVNSAPGVDLVLYSSLALLHNLMTLGKLLNLSVSGQLSTK